MLIRKSQARGITHTDWLLSYHSFSFGDYIDLNHRGFGKLRVINEDLIAPGAGFDKHPHWNMEIVTYVYEGILEHRDSIGNHYLINAGDVQRMSAGTGIEHSEYNASSTEAVKLLQIWILPEAKGMSPSYEQKHFDPKPNLQLIVSRDGRDGSLSIAQDIDIYILRLPSSATYRYKTSKAKTWLQIVRGPMNINGVELDAGDACGFEKITELELQAISDLEVLIFDML